MAKDKIYFCPVCKDFQPMTVSGSASRPACMECSTCFDLKWVEDWHRVSVKSITGSCMDELYTIVFEDDGTAWATKGIAEILRDIPREIYIHIDKSGCINRIIPVDDKEDNKGECNGN